MDKPILVIDSDGTLIASWRPFPDAYITKVKPDGVRYTAGVALAYPIDVNKPILRLIRRAKEAGFLIVLFTNNTNFKAYNKKGDLLGDFLDLAYDEIKAEYNTLSGIKQIRGPIRKEHYTGGSLFDYVITGNDPVRQGDRKTKNLAVLRRVLPGGDDKNFARRIYMFDDQVPTQEIAMEIPFGQYIQVPSFEQDEHGHSSCHGIHAILTPFLEAHPELGLRGSRSSKYSRRTRLSKTIRASKSRRSR